MGNKDLYFMTPRRSNSILLIAMIAVACSLLAGCDALTFTGSWSFLDPHEQDTVDAYQQFLQERDLATANASNGYAMRGEAVDPTPHQRRQSSYGTQSSVGTVGQPDVIPVWNPNRMPAEPPKPQFATNSQMQSRSQVQTASNRYDAPAPARSEPIRKTARPLDVFGGSKGGSQGASFGSPLDGTDNVSRISFTTEGGDFDPDVDPSGRWVCFASTRHRETSDIYMKRVDGTTLTQLTSDAGNDVSPTFSPDGKRVAYASDRGGSWDIYVVDVRGGQPIQITSDPTHEVHPSFSPDGRRLVYASHGTQSGQWEMVVVDIENPAVRRFIGYGLFPRWSPTGNRILFQRARERGTRWFSIWTVDLIDGEAMRPTEIVASANAAVITPSWSPDGQHIVFCTVVNPGEGESSQIKQSDVWIASILGNQRSNLTQGHFSNLQPRWAIDGTIYFVSNRGQGGVENIWATRPDRVLQTAQSLGQPTPVRKVQTPLPARRTQQTQPAARRDQSSRQPKQLKLLPVPETSVESTALVPMK